MVFFFGIAFRSSFCYYITTPLLSSIDTWFQMKTTFFRLSMFLMYFLLFGKIVDMFVCLFALDKSCAGACLSNGNRNAIIDIFQRWS